MAITPNTAIDDNSLAAKIIELQTALANISPAEESVLDAVTPGTVSASKAVVVDANKDVSGFRNVTVGGTTTPTGGVVAAGGFSAPSCFHTGGVGVGTTTHGTDTTPAVTETYVAEVFIPANTTLTGVSLLNGSAVAGNVTVSLANSAGAPIAGAVSAATAQSGTAAFQQIPFATPYAAVGPARYFVLVQFNNTSARFRSHLLGNFISGKKTGETYGTFTSVAAVTGFTTNQGPVADVY